MIFEARCKLDEGALANFLQERSNFLNRHHSIHNKLLLMDSLSGIPLFATSSANFSKPSQRMPNENMLVIRGIKRLADICFGEFMHLFVHHYALDIMLILTDKERSD